MDNGILTSRILVVDDKPANVMLLEQLLEEEGYNNVYSTTDSREVVRIYQEEKIDLILLDIRMPYMDGIEVMVALKDVIGDDDYLPILVLTAQTDMETHQKALSVGARDFITKPFQPWEIFQRIHNMLETRYFFYRQRTRANELDAEVRKRTKEIHDTQLEVLRRLGCAGEYRDNETGAHVLRMSKSCKLLAQKANLDEEFTQLLLEASPMHDVGKIGIPDNILLKPGRLTDEERAHMNLHVEIGVDIIGDFNTPVLEMARQIAQTHHEKWDGTGYPKGLVGQKIPIEGRIAAICDVFDALMSARPYKKAWTLEKATNLLSEEAGKHFDPNLIKLFLEIVPEVVKLRGEYPDEDE